MKWGSFYVATVAVAISAGVAAAPSVASGAQTRPPAEVRGAPYCDKSLWSSGKVKKTTLDKRLRRAINIIDNVDTATDAATVALVVLSGGISAPAFAVKAVAKIGAKKIIKVLNKLKDDLAKVNKRKAGVRLKIKCIWGVIPYPSLGIYT